LLFEGYRQAHLDSASPHLSHLACILPLNLQAVKWRGSKWYALCPHSGHFHSGAGPPQVAHRCPRNFCS